jgi:hypothetical protein
MAQDWFTANAPKTNAKNEDWFAKNAPSAKPDLTANPKGEGLYQVRTPQGKVVGLSYSNVPKRPQGWSFVNPAEQERFNRDYGADPVRKIETGPAFVAEPSGKAWGRALLRHPLRATEALAMPHQRPRGATTGEMLASDVANVGAGAISVPRHPIQTAIGTLQGVGGVVAAPVKAAMGKPTIFSETAEQLRENPELAPYGIGQAIAMSGLGETSGALGKKGIRAVREAAAKKYGPVNVPIAGEKVPVLVGEARPETAAGRKQIGLKRTGVSPEKFDRVTQAQQTAVKNVIRKTAQQTSGMIGTMAEEPGEAVQDASDATFAKARPMYTALDKSLIAVPDGLENVSKITQQTMSQAKKLGVAFGDENIDLSKIRPDKDGSIQWGGTRISQATNPERWNALVKEGIIDDSGNGTPLSAYIKVRSQLLKMQRSTADAATRNAISNEIRTMNESMETALKGTPLYENWVEANHLWSKGYALRDVADAFRKSTKGTPAAEQASGLSPIQTRILGPNLVNRLNALEQSGILGKAFTHDEISNLRQAADILDRARAATGSGYSFVHGYSLRSVFWRSIIRMPAIPFVNIMTKVDGVNALRAGEAARTPAQLQAALAALGVAVVGQSTTKPLGQLRQQAEQMAPVDASAEPSAETQPETESPDETESEGSEVMP